MKIKSQTFSQKILPLNAFLFFLANCIWQFILFKMIFLNAPITHEDMRYINALVDSNQNFPLALISKSISQPYIFISSFFNFFIENAIFSIRIVSLISGVVLLAFLCNYFEKKKFIEFIPGKKYLNKFIVFNIFFSVLFMMHNHFIGAPDVLSVAFGLPGFILLTRVLVNQKRQKLWLIGLLFALSFTSRPTFLVVLTAYLFSVVLIYGKQLFSKPLIMVGLFFVVFTGIINFYPLKDQGKLILDIKEIPKEEGTTWFEMNYVTAKKRDSGEFTRSRWSTSKEVVEFKKQNPDAFPQNHFDIIRNDTGLFFRQMTWMFIVSMYSSFRYLYLLFPFLLIYPFYKKKKEDKTAIKIVYFTLIFYFSSLLLFMVFAFKEMEFRWMYMPMLFFTIYSLDLTKNISVNKRLLLFNGIFALGILFFVMKMIRG
jgi:hypothetical protein